MAEKREKPENSQGPVGAVLVVGGGIGGAQASLDLAGSGYKVYLVDNKTAIGGMMAQLDKTFPTNDCAMCIMAPKLVECGRHKDIALLTNAEIIGIEGKPGNFKVQVRKHPRYVDIEKCTGCGDCADACPVEIANEFEENLSDRKAIYRLYAQAIPNAFAIEKEGVSPCKNTCPAGVSAQGYIALISQRKFKEALDVVRQRMPFPAICGRVCHHPCEGECNRKEIDQPIAIRPLKRFVADWVANTGEEPPERIEPARADKVAIIGAGPAGLTCAFDLLKLGYRVTVFEASDTPGGMIQSCLPEYRIPRGIAKRDIDWVINHGIQIKFNTPIGKDLSLEDLRNEGYKAIFVAIGAQNPKKLNIQGIEAQGVLHGIPFLREAKEGRKGGMRDRVIIIGGGNVAIDCAKSAKRLGASQVQLLCLETRDLFSKDRMPAHDWEIEEAEEEGVIIHPCLGPKRILSADGEVTGLETIFCTSVYEEDGRFAPVFEETLPAPTLKGDTVIIAIGQEPDFAGFEAMETHPWKTFKVDELTLETSLPGVFAGGDVVSGPASVVEAVQHGHEAAISMDRWLQGIDLKAGREKAEAKVAQLTEEQVVSKKRADLPKRPPEVRSEDFGEIELPYTSEEIAVEEAKRCLNCGVCSECLQCEETCEADAILHDMVEEDVELEVGAVLLAVGSDVFPAEAMQKYGYKRFPNVITSLQFERILSASGPFEGHLLRPSDRKPPHKIAWIQCVGSRDRKVGNPYCSAVCCMYAIKEAIIAKEHAGGELDTAIFFMDLRAYGKGFDAYYERAEQEYGVRFIRYNVCRIDEVPGTGQLRISYETPDDLLIEEEFDLVVLSVGLTTSTAHRELANALGIELNEYGFCRTDEFEPMKTSRAGLFVSGAFQGPKDIPESVAQASGAACEAAGLLAAGRGTLITIKEYPHEVDVSDQEPRIGAFICRCGINIGGFLNVPQVVEYARTLDNVVYAEENLYTCSQDTQQRIVEKIKEHNLNRVVVASCTPRTHEPLFQETVREAGLNPHLFEMANIRDQCSWIHMHEPEEALQKAKDLVRMAVAKARFIEPLTPLPLDVTPSALVIGGGLAGMTAALSVADQGYQVYLAEKEEQLGGNLRNIYYTLENDDVQGYLESLIERIEENPRITVYKSAEIEKIDGFVGNFKTILRKSETRNPKSETPPGSFRKTQSPGSKLAPPLRPEDFRAEGNEVEGTQDTVEVDHGVVIVATGAKEYQPKEYLYGQDDRVITQRELEKRLADSGERTADVRTVVMIQCVGSRNGAHPYCSRICCSHAVKNALRLKEQNPETDVFVLYRDMRTYRFREVHYYEAKQKGVVFVNYDKEEPPDVVATGDGLKVCTLDPVLHENLLIDADLVVLSPCIIPESTNEELSRMLKVPLDDDGFFLEAHVKLRPVDFATEGIFLAGMAHAPKSIDETVCQAKAAASRACTIVSQEKYLAEPTIAAVNEDICDGCGICEPVCEYGAIQIVTEVVDGEEKKKARLTEALCKGCGGCVAACPSGAMEQKGFKSEQLLAMVDAALE